MDNFWTWKVDQLRPLLREVLNSLKFQGKLTQKEIAAEAKVNYHSISKAISETSHVSAKSMAMILNSISKAYQIHYSEEGKLLRIGAFTPASAKPKTREIHFVYYYLGRTFTKSLQASRADLVINPETSEAKLTLYRNSPREPRMRYTGKLTLFPNKEFFLIFDQRENLESEEVEFVPGMCCFPMNNNQIDEDQYIGVFSSTEGVAGLCLLEKKNPGEIQSTINQKSVPSWVSFILGHHRIEAAKMGLPDNLKGVSEAMKKVQSMEGTYEAYLLESQNDREYIHKLNFVISDSSRIKFQSRVTGEQEGLIRRLLIDRFLVAAFSYHSETGIYDLALVLDLRPSGGKEDLPEDYLIGVYGGVEKHSFKPIAGRVLLRKVKQPLKPEPTRRILLSDKEKIGELLREEPYLRPFFRGDLDRYVDAPAVLEYSAIWATALPESPAEQPDPQVEKLAGLYECYHLSSDRRNIHSSPVEIKPDGNVIIKDQTEQEKKKGSNRYYYGKARYFLGSFLALTIQKRDKDDFFTHMLFYVGSFDYDRVQHFHGISSSITINNALRASREVLIKISGTLESNFSKRIPIPMYGESSPEYETLDKTYKGLASFLTGNAHNLIIPQRDPNAPFVRNENYGLLYFSSACYHAFNKDAENARKQLERAFQHGFRDKDLLIKELEAGMLSDPSIREWIDPERMMVV